MPDDLENEVQAALIAIFERYEAINLLVNEMIEKQDDGKQIVSEMQKLEDARREIELMERMTKDAKERYRVANENASVTVQRLTSESARLLTDTIKKIEKLEQNTRAAQQKLMPEIGESVRANQMQKAYGDR